MDSAEQTRRSEPSEPLISADEPFGPVPEANGPEPEPSAEHSEPVADSPAPRDAVPTWTAVPAWKTIPENHFTATTRPAAFDRPAPRGLRWVIAAVVTVVAGDEAIGRGISAVLDHYELSSAVRFALIAIAFLSTPALILLALRQFAIRRSALTPRGMGLRRPLSTKDAAALSLAMWLGFILFAGAWVTLTTPKDELESATETTQQVTPPESTAPSVDGTNPSPTPTTPSTPSTPTSAPSGKARAPRDDRHVLIKVLQRHPSTRIVVLIVLSACLLAPISEELFFRGFLFRAVAARTGVAGGAIVSALLFGLAHVQVVPLRVTVPLTVLGLGLAWLLQETGSLVPGVLVHGFVNALGVGVSAGFGIHTLTLILGTWLVLLLVMSPWIRRPVEPANSTAVA